MLPGDEIDLFALLNVRPAWQAEAACRGAGTVDYFPSRGESTAAAKAVCAGCPVRTECLDYALDTPADARLPGIWGGTSERERRGMRATATRSA
jgi:WhiB family transcriptional regulator, redox-sensing transcriptional regulator